MGLSSFVCYGVTLGLAAVCNGHAETVIGVAGERVTLPCGYSVKTYGVTDTCWGRGEIPYSKCSKMVVSTEGDKVTYRQSDRYKLLGAVRRGDVSLTIINATEADTGIYGCRVEIPGLFNDMKYNILLLIGRAPVVVTGPPVSITSTPQSGRAYWDSHIGTTDWDGSIGSQVQMQGSTRTLAENVVRIGAIILISVLILIIIIGLRRSKEKPQGSADPDYAGPAF